MSEAQRSGLYDWMCEQTDEAIAEYLMSCLSPVPLPDLATKSDVMLVKDDIVLVKDDVMAVKDDVMAVKSDLMALKDDVMALKSDIGRLEGRIERVEGRIERLETKVDWLIEARESDRKEAQTQFRWLIGLGATSFGVLLAAIFALAAITVTA